MSLTALGVLAQHSWGSPGDVLETDVPVLGGETPKSRDLKDGDSLVSTQTGAFEYGYPLTLPPGRRVAPSLSLNYSSAAGIHGSVVGAGWSLPIPEIRWDSSQGWLGSQSSDFVPRWVSSMAGGQRLVESPERGTAPCDVYKTFRAQFDGTYARYEQLAWVGSCHQNYLNGEWRVYTTDGLTHFFGEPEQMGDINDPTWAPLTRTVDEFGNQVKYFYTPIQDYTGHLLEHVLDRIEYTSNDSAGIAAHAQILFEYSTPESCSPSTVVALPVGARFEQRAGEVRYVGSRRLDRIRTQVRSGTGWRDVRTMALSYDPAADDCGRDHGPLRLLTSIQESAVAPHDSSLVTSMPPVTFSYGPLRPIPRITQPFDSGSPLGSDFPDSLVAGYRGGGTEWPQLETMLLDFDGDGRPDRLFADPDLEGCAFRWQRNEGDGFGPASQKIRLPTFHWGDGSGGPDYQDDCSLSGQRSTFDNGLEPPPGGCTAPTGPNYLSYRFLDINGDGKPELVAGLEQDGRSLDLDDPTTIPAEWGWEPCPELLSSTEPPQSLPGDGSGGCPPPRTHLQRCPGEYLWLIYWNQGDGVLDPVSEPSSRYVPLPLESNAQDTSLGNRKASLTSNLHAITDVDGDGLIDVLTRVSAISNNGFVVYRGDGWGLFHKKADGEPYLMDAPVDAKTGWSSSGWILTVPHSEPEPDEGVALANGAAGLLDVSGDGLPDLLYARSDLIDPPVVAYLNAGTTFYRSADPDGPGNPSWGRVLNRSVAEHSIRHDIGSAYGIRATWVSPLDFDADGRLDLYERVDANGEWDDNAATDTGYLHTGDGGGALSDKNLPAPPILALDDRDGVRQYLDADLDFRVQRDYTDLNGDGVLDYVEPSGGDFVYKTDADLLDGKPLRLLNRIDNGAGGITEIRYRASTDAAIDIPGTDDRLGMPAHTWVVDTITTSDVADALDTTGTVTGTTTYRYGRPIYNQARYPHPLVGESYGRYGFRGFERVQVTSPLGAVTESVYDYSLDWSGRLVETTVYAGSEQLTADQPESIEQTSWQALTLFCPNNEQASTIYPTLYYHCPSNIGQVLNLSFQPTDRKTWTCSSGQSKADCLVSAPRRVETTTWLGKVAADDDTGRYLLYRLRVVWKKRAGAIQNGDRRFFYTHRLFSGADFYRLRPASEHVFERVDGVDEERATRTHFWGVDPSGHDGAFETATRDHLESGATATTQMRNDLGLGLVTSRRKPEQYQQDRDLWTTISYDSTYPVQATGTTNELGHVVLTDYDLGTGALVSKRGPNSVGCGTGCTEYEGSRTVTDGFGRPLEVYAMTEDPTDSTLREVLVQRFTYLDNELPQKVIEERRIEWDGPDFTKVRTEFDGFGRVQTRTVFRFETGKSNAVERYRYDAQGNLARLQTRDPSVDDGANVVYQYSFDALDRPLRVQRPDGSAVEWTYDGLSATRREVAATGPEAETTTTEDVFGRLVRVDERRDASTVATTLYSWDANDNLMRVESPDGVVTDLFHDWMSRRTSIRRGQREWVYTYDLNGNLRTERAPLPPGADPVIDGPRFTTSTLYDDLDRPYSRVAGIRDLSPAQQTLIGQGEIAYGYDAGPNGIGRLTSVTSPIWTRSYEYDARGNQTEDSFHFDLTDALGPSLFDTRTSTRAYNPLGLAVDETHGDGATPSASTHTITAYDRRGLPKTLTWQQQMTSVTLATAIRNGAGLVTSIADADLNPTITQSWTYDSLGRVLGMQASSTAASPAIQISEGLTYYGADDPQTLTTFREGLGTRRFTFSFDDRHQLVSAFDDATYTGDFSYTPGGRLFTADISADGGAPLAPPRSVEYIYPTAAETGLDPDAVKELRSGPSSAFLTYGFDSAGNVTARGDGGGGQPDFEFVFDGDDQQRIATAQNGDHEIYYYDHSGQRILAVSRQPGGTVTKVHLWLGSLEVEYDGSNNVTQTLAHVGLDRPVARIENGATAKRVIHGQFGHFLGAFTPTGAALDVAFIYGPFGEILAQSGTEPADYTQRFNGKEQDALTSLSYYGARYFDPLSLTWTQADPLYRFAPDAAWDQPRRANLYAFNLENALKYVDPDGREPKTFTLRVYVPQGDRTSVATEAAQIAGAHLQRAAPPGVKVVTSVRVGPLSRVSGPTPKGSARILVGNKGQIADLGKAARRIASPKGASLVEKSLTRNAGNRQAGATLTSGKGAGTGFITSDHLGGGIEGIIVYSSRQAQALGNTIAHEAAHALGVKGHADDDGTSASNDLMNRVVPPGDDAEFIERKAEVRDRIEKNAVAQ